MTILFETPHFRVHITNTIAWIESWEPAGWVLRGQVTIPVSLESLRADAPPSILAAAVLEFEGSRPGDSGLRAALTGYRGSATVQILPRESSRSIRGVRAPRVSRRGTPKPFWTRGPLRPPLAGSLPQDG